MFQFSFECECIETWFIRLIWAQLDFECTKITVSVSFIVVWYLAIGFAHSTCCLIFKMKPYHHFHSIGTAFLCIEILFHASWFQFECISMTVCVCVCVYLAVGSTDLIRSTSIDFNCEWLMFLYFKNKRILFFTQHFDLFALGVFV